MTGRVVVFGASYATAEPLRAAIEAATGKPTELRGIVGATLATWSRDIPGPGSLADADVVVLELGGNGVAPANAILEADAKLRATGAARVRWVALRDWPDSALKGARTAAASNVRASGVVFLEVPGPSLGELAHDHAHLSPAGYRKLGNAIGHRLASNAGNVSPLVLGILAVVLGGGVAIATKGG